ncbi:hypothetical protein [Microvirga terricola]|uniref:UrcA family protein n=1 Tax=Microvirga terricola TaxID=2719797 RepID=A0ABX0VF89_9HYPH|nr:hypothetical protein [Microvirga terricola]NIX78313.1 hypothetical protein [Microvirga terricola]
MRAVIPAAMLLLLGSSFWAASEAQARFNALPGQAPSLVEDAACVVRRVRTVLPNGRVVYQNVRQCGVRPMPRCRLVRQRVVTPSGRVVFRGVRRCY